MSSLRKSFRLPWKTGKRYNVLEGKENIYFNTPKYKDVVSDSDIRRRSFRPVDRKLQRNSSLTKSVRQAVGSLKQVIFKIIFVSFKLRVKHVKYILMGSSFKFVLMLILLLLLLHTIDSGPKPFTKQE